MDNNIYSYHKNNNNGGLKNMYAHHKSYFVFMKLPTTKIETTVVSSTESWKQPESDLIGDDPKETICPSCRTEIHTEIRSESSVETHLLALIFCVFYCFPCSLLPYIMPMCRNTNHYCPNCGALIGVFFK